MRISDWSSDVCSSDLFIGQGVPEGQKSLAIEATLQPADKSFTEEELSAISMAIVKAAEKLGGTLRGCRGVADLLAIGSGHLSARIHPLGAALWSIGRANV